MSKANNYDVVLEKVGNQPLKTTKVLCGTLGLGLATAKAMVDKVPTIVAKGIEHDKALALRDELESLGNTVSIPGMETKAESSTTAKKATEPKKATTKKSAPSPLTVAAPSNDEFDAIFGGSTTQRATTPAKTNGEVKSKFTIRSSKASAASNDEFDAIFGSTEPKKKK